MQQTISGISETKMPLVVEVNEVIAEDEGVGKFLWTQKDYYRMAELGFFHGKRVELIEGEIFEMSPMNKPHATAVRKLLYVLRKLFIEGYLIDSQLPMSFSKITEPEPDVAVIKGKIDDFTKSHPKTAELIVEVSDVTLRHDCTRKASLYAKNKIKDYWILNVKSRQLEIHRRPKKGGNAFYGFSYADISIYTENDSAAPLTKPEAKIKIVDILP